MSKNIDLLLIPAPQIKEEETIEIFFKNKKFSEINIKKLLSVIYMNM